MTKRAKRFNGGKLRYELIPDHALKLLAEVYTRGAHKYSIYKDERGEVIKGSDIPFEELGNIKLELIEDGANNWRLGQNWLGSIASVQRHIAAWKGGEDIDQDPAMKTHHLANAAWGLMSLLEYYKIYPQGDDRTHNYLNQPKIGLDIDEVLADFVGALMERFPEMSKRPVYWNDPKLGKYFAKVKDDDEFWLSIKPRVKELPFEPHCYITSRPVSSELTKKWLDLHGFPVAPIRTVGHGESKVDVAKEMGVDIFVDDAYHNFVELNKAGICCYLMDAPHNARYDVGHKRIFNLNELVK